MRKRSTPNVACRNGIVFGATIALLAGVSTSASAATETVLYSFKGPPDGAGPAASLINVGGTLYGTTQNGGTGSCTGVENGCGTVFSILPGGAETVVHSFQGYPVDGSAPLASLLNVDGTLYGTTRTGGPAVSGNGGTIFSVNPVTGAEKLEYWFGQVGEWGADGSLPLSNLINVKGTLYGMTQAGGANADGTNEPGTVFSFKPKTGAEAVVYSFSGGTGAAPEFGGLIYVAGIFYGTTFAGGPCGGVGCGVVFSVTPGGSESAIYTFQGGSDGAGPAASLINVDGTLWGTTTAESASLTGTVFSVNPQTGVKTLVYAFPQSCAGMSVSNLIRVKGKLYGTTSRCGANSFGSVFSINLKTGAETVVYSFQGGNDGAYPAGGLINVGGTLYGTTYYGGGTGCGIGCGTVFSLNP